MIDAGTVKPKEIVQTFGVPMVTVKRHVRLYRDHGAKGFYAPQPRHSSASVLKGPVLEQAERLLDGGRSVPQAAAELNVLPNTLHKAIRAGRFFEALRRGCFAAREWLRAKSPTQKSCKRCW